MAGFVDIPAIGVPWYFNFLSALALLTFLGLNYLTGFCRFKPGLEGESGPSEPTMTSLPKAITADGGIIPLGFARVTRSLPLSSFKLGVGFRLPS